MSVASNSVVDRAIRLRVRPDLQMAQVRNGHESFWNVKDPCSLRYFQLRREEHFVLTHLDGKRTLRELQRLVEQRFAPRKLSVRHLQTYLGGLHRRGLTIAASPGQSRVLLRRRDSEMRSRWLGRLANPLAIRFRGVDPGDLLDRVYELLRPLFRRETLAAMVLVVFSAVIMIAIRWAELKLTIPNVEAFLSVSNVVLLAVALCFVKLLHEAAHALTCRHFNAECSEIGLMLLVGVPCLYCNISDAWMLPDKWQRIAVSAAGVVMELFIAACFALIWCFTGPGLLNAVSFNLLVICSVSTLVLNGNPLLRFDGYFVLSDLLETPNLWSTAQRLVRDRSAKLLLGIRPSAEPVRSAIHPTWLTCYGLASLIYRAAVVAMILWVCVQFFDRQRMSPVGHLIAAGVLLGLASVTLRGAVTCWRDPAWRSKVKLRRACSAVLVTSLLVTAFWFVPLPRRLRAPVVIVPEGAAEVHVVVPGFVDWTAEPGASVQAGDPLCRLRNPQLAAETAAAEAQLRVQELLVEQLHRRRIRDASIADELADSRALRDALEAQWRERKRRSAMLKVVSSHEGEVLRGRRRESSATEAELETWSGSPLDAENHNAFLEADTLLCLIGDPNHLAGEVLVDFDHVDSIEVGQKARIAIETTTGLILTGRVVEVDAREIDIAPPEVIAAKRLAVDPSGQPVRDSYRVRIAIDPPREEVPIGSTGTAVIEVASCSLGTRLWRALQSSLFRASPLSTE